MLVEIIDQIKYGSMLVVVKFSGTDKHVKVDMKKHCFVKQS